MSASDNNIIFSASAQNLDRDPSPTTRPSYGLKSTPSSREAAFEADSDSLDIHRKNNIVYNDNDDDDEDDDVTLQALSVAAGTPTSRRTTGDLHTPDEAPRTPTTPTRLIDRIPLISSAAGRGSLDSFGNELRQLRERHLPDWDPNDLPDWLRRSAGVLDSTWNMANSILGAGVVGLPLAMREAGFVAGLVLLVGLALLTDWTIRLIVLNAKLSGAPTYIEIMERCFGHPGKAAVSVMQFAFAFGGMCAFCVVIGDTLPHVITWLLPGLAGSFLANRQFVILASTLLISYPLSLYRNIESLSKASAIALVSMVLIIVTVVVRGPAMPAELTGDPGLRFTIIYPTKLVRSISVISFAFVCHHNSLLIFSSLKEPSMDKFGKVTHYSTMIAAIAAIVMSVGGYWSFEEKTLGNILNNFPQDDTMVNIARFCFGLNMLTTFPLEAFVAREVLETYFFANEFDHNRHLIFTSSLVVSALFVSLMTCDLGIVLELTGGLSATSLAFIFPAVCYLKLDTQLSQKPIPDGLDLDGDHQASGGVSPAERAPLASTDAHGNGGIEADDDDDDEDGDDLGTTRKPASTSRANGRRVNDGDGTDGHDTLEDLEGAINGSSGPEYLEDLELPLRPGASLRHRGSGRYVNSKRRRWWQSIRPLAWVTTAFGVTVLVISIGTALSDFASGRTGAVHQC
ncbi:hypothetical protein OC846_000927 [Tilletia horrida]|uniref:Amino acid transporter transmembrane domain-containing protein n=1 Tax=Tilletia horrida TaxID=155126 RepID=A0AAN6GW36_9BASI|nr:hypothetical protein OC845_000837 [Tilletia horrida]KAK0556739.1 hypothetical protein OC846_000927 [Tilletia horrida]